MIAVDTLPLHFDAEMPAIMWEVLSTLPGLGDEQIQIQISNRKILIGLLEALGVSDITTATRLIDKLDKLPRDEIAKLLAEQCSMNAEAINKALKLASIKTPDARFIEQVHAIGVDSPAMNEGVQELAFVMGQLAHLPGGAVMADLSIVRGLDYYTGTVCRELRFVDDPGYGSICSGGRYDDLAGSYINKHLPGVGISVGFSRLFDRIRMKGNLPALPFSPADVLVVLPSEERRSLAADTARTLRERGFNVEVFHAPSKLKRQMAYAEKKGIPYVWFPPFEDGAAHEVKDMAEGKQLEADPANWMPV